MYDQSTMELYGNNRIAVGVAMFIGYFFHYFCVALANFYKKEKLDKMAFIEKRMWMFGAISALSIGIVQGSVFVGLFSWFTVFIFIIIHLAMFFDEKGLVLKFENTLWLIYYILLCLWSIGIFGDNLNFTKNVQRPIQNI